MATDDAGSLEWWEMGYCCATHAADDLEDKGWFVRRNYKVFMVDGVDEQVLWSMVAVPQRSVTPSSPAKDDGHPPTRER